VIDGVLVFHLNFDFKVLCFLALLHKSDYPVLLASEAFFVVRYEKEKEESEQNWTLLL